MPRSQVQQEAGDMRSAEGGTAYSRSSVQNVTQQAEGWEQREQGSVGDQRLQRWTDQRFLTTEERHRQQRQTRTGPQSEESWAVREAWAAGEERHRQQRQTRTGPQSAESWAIREASRQRLAEQRQRERDEARWQRALQQQEEEERRRQERRRREEEEDLQRRRRDEEEFARRRQELAAHARQSRERARSERQRQELELSASGRRRLPRQDIVPTTPTAQETCLPDITQQKDALARLVQAAERTFEEKQEASARRDWCDPVPTDRKLDTVQSFLKAFHDEGGMEIATCSVCYLKKTPQDVEHVDWKKAIPAEIQCTMAGLLVCERCFPQGHGGTVAPICSTCRRAFDRHRVPEACMGSSMLVGCEHRYPRELRDLTPLEEKLISLNAAYGFITKFNVKHGQQTGTNYRKHVVGHITVFPNDVESLAATILPHPLVSTLDQVHVIWTGSKQPTPRDVGKLLSVRPRVLRSALQWLQSNNPLYANVNVNEGEMESWSFEEDSGVPTVAYQRMVREQETAEEVIRTAQIVPPTDRGQNPPGETATIEDIAMELAEMPNRPAQPEPTDAAQSGCLEEAVAAETSEPVFELRSSAMFPIDEQNTMADQDKLQFVSQALHAEREDGAGREDGASEPPSMVVYGSSERPFIRVSRGGEFADAFSPDYFPKTFPTCFPYGRGGPQVAGRNEAGEPASPLLRDMTIESWAKVVLQRHGGRFVQHPAFSFLIFNMLVRSKNRQVAQGRLKRSAFRRVEGIHRKLTAERLIEAQKEMVETGKTTDRDVIALMKELSLYGHRHALSNESRLSMRKKIWSMIVAFGLTAIWFTVNPNDINSPIKLKLAAHREAEDEAARALLRALNTSLQVTTLSIHDPLSSTLFFFREISLFFQHYVRVGRPSIYGNVSHYYATVETNDRGALHLHGLLWVQGNLSLPDLVRDMANPDEGDYRSKVKSFVDDVFTETLSETLAKEEAERGKKTTLVESELMHDVERLAGEFQREANFIASRCQVHHHTATCMKYSIKEVLKAGPANCKTQLCRFRAPWRLVAETGFTDDGLLEVKRDHQMVNRYNQSMAIGLRHNHDVSMILTRKKGLALIHYICNYATKLNAPMWKRLSVAAELQDLSRQHHGGGDNSGITPSTIGDETKTFLLRVANRVFTSRELSQPEVLSYLLGFNTDFTNVPFWAWVHLNALYWACAKQWPNLHGALSVIGREPQADGIYFQESGFKLSLIEAYKQRGPILADLCLYDYMSFIALKRERSRWRGSTPIPFPPTATVCSGWTQCLRAPGKTAVPVLDGRLTDEFVRKDENFVSRNAVLHLALFVPWQRFQKEAADDIPGLWQSFEETLGDRIRSHVRNISLLRVSAEDARADRKLQALDQDTEEVGAAFDFGHQGEGEGSAEEDDGHIESQVYHSAFLGVLSAALGSEISGLPVSSALRRLDGEARDVDMEGDDVITEQRGREFYTMLQGLQDSPFQGIGLLGREEIEAISKLQKKTDRTITADIQGRESNEAVACADEPIRSPRAPTEVAETPTIGVGVSAQMSVEVGPYTSYVDIALALTRHWTLNKLQSLAVLLPAVFLDERGSQLQEMEGKQHLQYVGGEGGTGKSRVIHAIKDMFRLKDNLHTLLVTGASGNAAALIGGVTLHSAANIRFEGNAGTTRNISEEEKLRWKNKTMLIVDEISQVGGLTLAAVDGRLRQYRDDAHRPFGGIPIVIFLGDFFQFDPVLQTSLLLPKPKDYATKNPESVAKHVAAYKLFRQLTAVILREQVRTAGCAKLRGFLQRLRNGEQTELDFQRLCCLYDKPSQPSFADGLRAITPLNQDRWNLNMAAVVQWGRANSKHISIFIAKHDTEGGRQLYPEELCDVLRHGDDSQLQTPGLFFYAQGMPVVATRNQLTGLKLVNGAPFTAVDIFPDLASGTIALASDVTLHLRPPAAVLLQSDDIADIAIPGLPKGTILIKSQAVRIPDSLRGNGTRSRGRPGFAGVTHRTGPLCTPAFAMTDQKSQGKQFSDVLLNLKSMRGGSSLATKPSFMSLYVQLSRAERWRGLHLFRKPARGDFIEPKNVLDREMRDAVLELERRADETRQRLGQDYKHERWFHLWNAMPEATAAGEATDGEDGSLWNDTEDRETGFSSYTSRSSRVGGGDKRRTS